MQHAISVEIGLTFPLTWEARFGAVMGGPNKRPHRQEQGVKAAQEVRGGVALAGDIQMD